MPDVSGFQNLEKISDDFSVIICGKTTGCIGTAAATRVFENILSDLPVIKIYQFANKVHSGIATPWNPFDIKMNTVFIAYATRISYYKPQLILAVAWLSV